MWYIFNLTPPFHNYDGREIEDTTYEDLTETLNENDEYQEVYCG